MDLDSYPSNFLAFRSSCDRCRYMKLKCPSNGTESHEPCERCLKAKLPCKYSRRTNSSRRSATRPDSTLDASEAHDRISVPGALVQNQLSNQSDRSPTSDSALIPEVQPETPGAFCFSDALNSVAMELPWMDWDVPSTDSTVPLWSTQSPPLSEPRKAFSAQGILNLASLAVELGECLQLLNRDVRAQSIDEYPIGHIRHLSQAFVVSSQKGLAPLLDVSATLLLLSCYVSLRKLFINAFGNIRDNLPVDNEMQAQLPHRQDYKNMSLRGMDALSQRCLRSYTAFNMTLEFMNNCDAAIHLCTVCRPQGQSPQSKLMASLQYVRTVGDAEAPLEEPPSVCIACGLPASVKQEAASIFNAIADQECALHELTSILRGTLGQRIGLL